MPGRRWGAARASKDPACKTPARDKDAEAMVKQLRIFFAEEFNGSALEQMKHASYMMYDFLAVAPVSVRFEYL